jgi:hypothetical protein
MDETMSNKAAAAAGLLGAVLVVVAGLIAGAPPRPDDATAKVVHFLVDKRSAVLAGYLLALVGGSLLLWFVGRLRTVLADAGDPTLANATVAAWVLLFAIVGIGFVLVGAVAWRGADRTPAALVRFAWDASTLALYSLSAAAALLSILAPIIVIGRTGVLPRWLVGLGLVEIAVNLAELGGLFARRGWDAGGLVVGLGPLVWSVWVAAAAIVMYRATARR